MNEQIIEYLYKGVISFGVGLALYYLKDFKADVKKLTDGLTAVSLSLQTLLTKDTHKEEAISELKEKVEANHKAIQNLKIRVALLENNIKKQGE